LEVHTVAENEPLRMALEHYLQQKRNKLEEVRQIDLIISRLKADLGEASTAESLSDAVSDSLADTWRDKAEVTQSSSTGGGTNVRADEFFGMTYTTAATAYLERVGHAVPMDELLDALNKGGCPVGGKDPKKTLYISLIRAVKTFVPIPGKSGYLGLRKFYPNLKAAKESKEEKNPRTKRAKKRGRKAKTASPAGNAHQISAKEKSRPAADQTAQTGGTEK
jgi:hypothetical protein